MAESAAEIPKIIEETIKETAQNVTDKPPTSIEGIAIAYLSLVIMAVLPIFFGSFRSVKYLREQKEAGERPETMSNKDALMFPVIASCALFGLYVFFQFFSKEYINLLLTGYFFFLGVLALSHLLSPVISLVVPASIPNIPYHIHFTRGEHNARTDIINYKFTSYDVICLIISLITGAWYLFKKRIKNYPHPAMINNGGSKVPYHIHFTRGEHNARTDIINYKFTSYDVICLIISLITGAWYLFKKHWIANNLFGIAFAINGVELLHLNNVVTGCILLAGLFLYDIFWVFGTNVMVTVAKSFEAPIKLVFPQDLLINGFNASNFAMLGLGDIVVPGIFIALLLRFDKSLKRGSEFYFRASHFAMLGLGDIVVPGIFIALLLRFDKSLKRGSEFYFSTIHSSRLLPCGVGRASNFAMLGLGDIVVPGIFIALLLRFDKSLKRGSEFYFRQRVPGIFIALLLRFDKSLKRGSEFYFRQRVPGIFIALLLRFDKSLKRGSEFYFRQRVPGIFIALLLRFDKSLKRGSEFYFRQRVPGIFIALLLRFDKSLKRGSEFYFRATFSAYILGLLATILVMHMFKHAQPALLYLVPACLGTPLTLALLRGDINALFNYILDLLSYILGLLATILVMHMFKHAQPALLYLVPACLGTPLTLALLRGDINALFNYILGLLATNLGLLATILGLLATILRLLVAIILGLLATISGLLETILGLNNHPGSFNNHPGSLSTILGLLATVLGLLATILVMHMFKHAQPALLYLVPACLGTPLTLALLRGDINALFK
ncbi:signal peptide peptidase domain-containing protein [Phthorimaea operculella]|nr:signal peptide peptidase domain-containing protein [Phthorimaea operculella]